MPKPDWFPVISSTEHDGSDRLSSPLPQDPQPTADTSSAADHAEPDAVTPDATLAPDADPEDPRTS